MRPATLPQLLPVFFQGRISGKAFRSVTPLCQAPCCNGGKMLKMGVKMGETPNPTIPVAGLDGAARRCPTSFSVRGGTFSSRSMPFTTTPFFSLTGALKTILDVLL